MRNLSSIFLESTDDICVSNCCRAMVSFAKSDHLRSDEVRLMLKKICEKLLNDLSRLIQVKKRLQSDEGHDDEDNEETSESDIQNSIKWCLLRLRVISKRCSIAVLLDDNKMACDAKLDDLGKVIHEHVSFELKARQPILHRPESQEGDEKIEISEIWSSLIDKSIHSAVAESVREGLGLLLSVAAWRLHEAIESKEDDRAKDSSQSLDEHIVLRLRRRMKEMLILCFEQFVPVESADRVSDEHVAFAVHVQENALVVSGDMRALFPRRLEQCESKFLQKCPFTDENLVIGAGVRFIQSQEEKVSWMARYGYARCLL
jgi:hypothetical protein